MTTLQSRRTILRKGVEPIAKTQESSGFAFGSQMLYIGSTALFTLLYALDCAMSFALLRK